MFWKKEKYDNGMEILATQANLVTLTGTVSSTDVAADDHGKKYVLAGSLIDANGAVVTQTGDVGSETLSSIPIGILYTNIEVTNGDMACPLIVEGYVRADRVLDGFADLAAASIKEALPEVKFI